ncbi:hypothetical protein B296_00005098 [Ensete ventricosum]|uniref:Uncharacterized protein n=1 Tax=Ensete ventricosum TaxID=4639 RepID=A0A427AZY1_ENSVE|nr:hypothetical protein B296_00005098 [Ensete ventricosum]
MVNLKDLKGILHVPAGQPSSHTAREAPVGATAKRPAEGETACPPKKPKTGPENCPRARLPVRLSRHPTKFRARTQSIEDELLKSAQDIEAMWSDLQAVHAKAIAKYKESPGFKMWLQRIGQVLYKYGYQVALAQF